MFGSRERDAAFLEALGLAIAREYGLNVWALCPAERGWYGETWVVEAREGKFFAKLVCHPEHQARYRRSFSSLEALTLRGLTWANRVARRTDGALWLPFAGGVLGLFEFVEGEHTEEYPLDQLFELLARQYQLPVAGLDAPRERFDLGQRTQFFEHYHDFCEERLPGWQKMAALIEAHRPLLTRQSALLERAAGWCQGDETGFCATTGDVGGNVIVSRDGRMTIIDWDDIRLAPPERDLWYYIQDMRQMDIVHDAFARQGFGYRLRGERLAYYCLSMSFFYLREFLNAYRLLPERRDAAWEALQLNFSEDYFLAKTFRSAEALVARGPGAL